MAQAVVEIGSHDGNDTGVIFTEGLENGAQRAWRVRSFHRHVDTVNTCAADGDEDFEDILIGDDADQHTVIVHNGQASDFFIQHEQRRRSHRISAFDGDGLRGHDVLGLDFCQKVLDFVDFEGSSLGRRCAFHISVGNNADDLPVFIDNRKTMKGICLHQLLTLGERGSG